MIDAGGITKFPAMPWLKRLTIIVDNDENGVGEKAAAECLARWEAAGLRARSLMPPTPETTSTTSWSRWKVGHDRPGREAPQFIVVRETKTEQADAQAEPPKALRKAIHLPTRPEDAAAGA